MTHSELIASLPADYFVTVLLACPRKARETLFVRFGVPKAKKKVSALLPGRDPQRIGKLQVALGELAEDDEEGQRLSEEVLRLYLLNHRALLAATLDKLGVEHDEGLTEEELDVFDTMEAEAAKKLSDDLVKDGFSANDVSLYLNYVGAPLG